MHELSNMQKEKGANQNAWHGNTLHAHSNRINSTKFTASHGVYNFTGDHDILYGKIASGYQWKFEYIKLVLLGEMFECILV